MIYGTGIDIVEISRFQKFIDANNVPLFCRIFTSREMEYCSGKKRAAQHYALRFAAKEAFLKALGTGLREGISWREMEVVHDDQGKPELLLYGRAEQLFASKGLGKSFVSLSHDANCAIASVILEM